MELLVAAIGWAAGGSILIAAAYYKIMLSLWREPVLRVPLLIFESDDWGAGPLSQAPALERLEQILESHRDAHGRSAVMTLGVVLAIADCGQIRRSGTLEYARVRLDEPIHEPVLEAIRQGERRGVFALQLHGMEHYWPAALMAAATGDPAVRDWFESDNIPLTEGLPSPFQSRWIDASSLPSKALSADEIKTAIMEEIETFKTLFKQPPKVAVPTTFIWSHDVEIAWKAAGIQVVVTPGQRYESRDRNGAPMATGGPILNGQIGKAGLIYVVRDDYFEPALGHTAERGLAAIGQKARLGRPALLEMHRFNFVRDPHMAETAMKELDRLLSAARQRFQEIRFTSTEELAARLVDRDPAWVEHRLSRRIHLWLLRLRQVPRLWKLACLSGAIVPAGLLYMVTLHAASPHSEPASASNA